MRGTLVPQAWQEHGHGNTPAYAGNTLKKKLNAVLQEEHPRVCGEHPYTPVLQTGNPGTPPRMRGTLGGSDAAAIMGRNTPAYAGNTRRDYIKSCSGWEHPRVCGEHCKSISETENK